MKTLKFLCISLATLGLMMATNAKAATSDPVVYQTPPCCDSTIYHTDDGYLSMSTDGSFTNGTGPTYTYLIEDANPNAVHIDQLNLAFDEAADSGLYPELVGYDVTNFYSTGDYPAPTENTDIFTNVTFSAGHIDLSSLSLTFDGFLIKAGNETLVGLFDPAISELWFQSFNGKGISHIAVFNLSQVPVPAALWLFAPALLGLFGLRKQHHAA